MMARWGSDFPMICDFMDDSFTGHACMSHPGSLSVTGIFCIKTKYHKMGSTGNILDHYDEKSFWWSYSLFVRAKKY